MSQPTPDRPGALASLRRGWGALAEDPVRLLSASAGCLLADLALGAWILRAWRDGAAPPARVLAVAVGLWWLVRAPLRAGILVWGARTLGAPPRPIMARALTVGVLDAIVIVCSVVGALVVAVPAGWITGAVFAQGALPGAALLGLLTGALAYAGALLARAVLAPAYGAVAWSGAGPFRALRDAWRAGPRSWRALAAVLVVGDVGRTVGSALLAVGALPFTPWPWLAVVAHTAPMRADAPSPPLIGAPAAAS